MSHRNSCHELNYYFSFVFFFLQLFFFDLISEICKFLTYTARRFFPVCMRTFSAVSCSPDFQFANFDVFLVWFNSTYFAFANFDGWNCLKLSTAQLPSYEAKLPSNKKRSEALIKFESSHDLCCLNPLSSHRTCKFNLTFFVGLHKQRAERANEAQRNLWYKSIQINFRESKKLLYVNFHLIYIFIASQTNLFKRYWVH